MISLAQAQAWVAHHSQRQPTVTTSPHDAVGHVLAADLPLDASPTTSIAAIDGWAVTAAHTEGASDYAPLPVPTTAIRAGNPLPPGTDTVLEPEALDHGHVAASVPRGQGVLPPGHDIPHGFVLPAGTRLGPLHLAMLPADTPIPIHPQPTIGGTLTPTLQALAHDAGAITAGQPTLLLNPPDPFTTDHPALALRPGETTQLGHIERKPAIRLPPHPADAATVFALLVAPTIRRLAGRPEPTATPARLTRKIASSLGRTDAIRVRLEGTEATPLGPADQCPLTIAATASGLVLVPEASEGYPAGAMVPVIPL